jgi:hypothetical protein
MEGANGAGASLLCNIVQVVKEWSINYYYFVDTPHA